MRETVGTALTGFAPAAPARTGPASLGRSARSAEQAPPSRPAAETPALTGEQIRTLIDRVIAQQHRDDAALGEYERREHRIQRTEKRAAQPEEDKLYRVVPTGTGTLRLVLEERAVPVSPEYYRYELRELEKSLLNALDPNAPKQRQAIQKWNTRVRERAEAVEDVRHAFLFTWLGRETRDGRTLVKLRLDPNPAYRPRSRTTELFVHARVMAWIDPEVAHLTRLEAELVRDISFGGGWLGKVYRGGRFVLEQMEVAPGVWLPKDSAYDLKGRKFLFGSELHETVEASGYRHIGPPETALATIRQELKQAAASGSSP